jgi:hypothetical protein
VLGVASGDDVAPLLPTDPRFLDDLRRARRRRRVAEVHWVDALYRAYMAALFGVLGIALLGGAVGDEPLTTGQVADVRVHGPAVIGLVASLVVAIGLRSGSRGGPLAVEPGDVRHVLLSPVARAVALRGPALRQLRTALFVALLVGAAIGRFAERRFEEAAWAWIASCAAAVAVTVALGLGAALVVGGHRVSRPVATLVGMVLVGWSVADVATRATGSGQIPASPGRAVGWLALAPLDLHVAPVAAVLVAVALVAAGVAGVGGTSVEAAERRTALVGQIRFAATLQDLRTVMVLRRQLAADQPRDRPWLPRGRGGHGSPVWRRGWTGLLRFPAGRLGRIALLIVLAGVALRVAWSGTAPVVVLAGLAVWIIGLDLVEPLAQEVDHPSRRELYPVTAGSLHVRLRGPSLVGGALSGLLVGGAAVLPGAGQVPLGPGLVTGVAAGLTGVVGAVANVVSGVPTQSDELSVIAPEVAGTRLALRALLPPVLATAGALPLLIVEADLEAGRPEWSNAPIAWMAAGVASALVLGWVHQREEILHWWEQAQEAARASTAADRDAGDERDEDEDDPHGAGGDDDAEERR